MKRRTTTRFSWSDYHQSIFTDPVSSIPVRFTHESRGPGVHCFEHDFFCLDLCITSHDRKRTVALSFKARRVRPHDSLYEMAMIRDRLRRLIDAQLLEPLEPITNAEFVSSQDLLFRFNLLSKKGEQFGVAALRTAFEIFKLMEVRNAVTAVRDFVCHQADSVQFRGKWYPYYEFIQREAGILNELGQPVVWSPSSAA